MGSHASAAAAVHATAPRTLRPRGAATQPRPLAVRPIGRLELPRCRPSGPATESLARCRKGGTAADREARPWRSKSLMSRHGEPPHATAAAHAVVAVSHETRSRYGGGRILGEHTAGLRRPRRRRPRVRTDFRRHAQAAARSGWSGRGDGGVRRRRSVNVYRQACSGISLVVRFLGRDRLL